METSKIAKSVKPPAKRSEIVVAAALRLIQSKKEEYHRNEAALNATETELHQKTTAHLQAEIAAGRVKPHLDISISRSWSRGESETLSLDAASLKFSGKLPPALTQALLKLHRDRSANEVEFRWLRGRDKDVLNQAKAKVRATMDGTQDQGARIKAMLKDPESVKILDKIVAAVDKPAQLAITSGE